MQISFKAFLRHSLKEGFCLLFINNSDNTCYVNYPNEPSRGLTRVHERISAAQNEVLHRENSQRRVKARTKRQFLLAFCWHFFQTPRQ